MSALRIVLALLRSSPDLVATTGGSIFPVIKPQGTSLPNVSVSLVSESEDQHLAGATGNYDARVSVACHAASMMAADSLAELVKSLLGNITNMIVADGESPTGALGATTIMKADTDFTDYADDFTVFRRVVDFDVRWWAP
jgi:hypothetical protein